MTVTVEMAVNWTPIINLSHFNPQHIQNFYFQTVYYPARIMSSKSNKRFAPNYQHNNPHPPAAPAYAGEWKIMREELLKGMGADSTKTPRIDNGPGDRHTVHSTKNLRYDRERVLTGNGHPADKFTNYQIQANKGADNRHLKQLAASGNGQHKASGAFGGSTVASVNLQQPPAGR